MSELVAFFSRAGKNYVNGEILNLDVGNTELAAEFIQEATGAGLYKIEPVVAYSKDYSECIEEAKEDQRRNARPALKHPFPDMEHYSVIYLGYPNYWGTVPMPVFTFLENCKLAGKTIRPFCTHEGSGMGHSVEDIKKLCPDSMVKTGLALHGADIRFAKNTIIEWLKGDQL